MAAYYNENDPYAAQWLRNLIEAGLIADGFVDERSIRDVQPCDIWGFDQCHFFAGIGIWSAALRAAGVPDDFPVWTGSCPCQPFSGAGERRGFDDERHLWPEWRRLIAELRPAVVLGEQVGGGDGLAWFDLVQAHMEGMDYACGALVAPAAGFGAPHGRHRIWFVADATEPGWRQSRRTGGSGADRHPPESGRFCTTGELGLADGGRRAPGFAAVAADGYRRAAVSASPGNAGGVADTRGTGWEIGRGDGRVQCETMGAREGQAAERGGDLGFVGYADRDRRAQRLPACERNGYRYPAVAASSGNAGELADARRERGEPNRLDTGGASRDRSEKAREQRLWSDDRASSELGVLVDAESEQAWISRFARERRATAGFWSAADWIPCRGGKWRPVEPGTFPLVDGYSRRVEQLRAYGNAVVLPAATEFIKAALGAIGDLDAL